MAENLWRRVDGNGQVVELLNDRESGYRLHIARPDGTEDFRKVSGPQDANTVSAKIINGEFT